MRIDRAALLADLNQFVRADSGVIVGGPGVGKSYVLGELADQLDAQDTAYLFLMIDTLGEVAEADLRRELGYEGTDLIASLAGTDLREEKGILIIDGYDAARNERTQKNALEMAWEVVVSGRPPGFNLDSLAIEEVVKITESILADYRLQARNEATLGQIFEILEIFSETGWPQALRLVWRLDEVYR